MGRLRLGFLRAAPRRHRRARRARCDALPGLCPAARMGRGATATARRRGRAFSDADETCGPTSSTCVTSAVLPQACVDRWLSRPATRAATCWTSRRCGAWRRTGDGRMDCGYTRREPEEATAYRAGPARPARSGPVRALMVGGGRRGLASRSTSSATATRSARSRDPAACRDRGGGRRVRIGDLDRRDVSYALDNDGAAWLLGPRAATPIGTRAPRHACSCSSARSTRRCAASSTRPRAVAADVAAARRWRDGCERNEILLAIARADLDSARVVAYARRYRRAAGGADNRASRFPRIRAVAPQMRLSPTT